MSEEQEQLERREAEAFDRHYASVIKHYEKMPTRREQLSQLMGDAHFSGWEAGRESCAEQVASLTTANAELLNENIALKNGYKAACAERDALREAVRKFIEADAGNDESATIKNLVAVYNEHTRQGPARCGDAGSGAAR